MTKKLTMLAVVTVSALAGAYTINYINNQALESSAQSFQQQTGLLNKKIAQLQKENAQLNLLLIDKKNTLSSASSTAIPIQPLPSAQSLQTKHSNEPTPVEQLQDKQVLQTSEKFSSWLANAHRETGSFNLHKEMQRQFAAEDIDPSWAEAQEQEYLTLFSQSPELAGLALRETRCRTQQCALTISISDINQANELLGKMSDTLKAQNKYPMIIATPDEQQGVTTLYIGKDTNSFEFN